MWKSWDHTDAFNPKTIARREKFRWTAKKISSVYNDGISILHKIITIHNSLTEKATEQTVTKVLALGGAI
jgi:hypothetical protein